MPRLIREKTGVKRKITIVLQVLSGLIGLALIWLGLNSVMVGLSRIYQKGFWVPCLAGTVLLAGGIWIVALTVKAGFRDDSNKLKEII